MGFFSSRKDEYTHSAATDDKPRVVQVIRSRFYGKSKGKEKDDTDASFSTTPSAAQALSPPLVRRPTAVRNTPRPVTTYETSSGTSNGRPTTLYTIDISNQSSHNASSSRFLEPSSSKTVRSPKPMQAEPASMSDVATVTLAQRLDELAVANSDGLLNDEEYRMLRRDLFERFASGSSVPTESALVPTSTRPRAGTGTSKSSLTPSRPSSQYHVDTTRTPSIHSKGSVSSGMASFFSRRTTDTRPRSNSKDQSDVSSVFSTRSNFSNNFKLSRLLSRKTSQSSVGTEVSQSQADVVSISSRRTDKSHGDRLAHFSPSVARSTGASSIRRMATPPSSFPSRIGPSDTHSPVLIGVANIFDEANLTTSQDIHKEILAVESEKRRLMDSFNSLELRLLTQNQRRGLPGKDFGGDTGSLSNTSLRTVDRGEGLRRRALENDSMSIRSGLSTSPSIARSAASWKSRSVRTGTRPPSISDSLHRKNSKRTLEEVPPMPALPSKMTGYLGVPTSHSGHSPISPSSGDNSSFLTLDTLPEDEGPSLNEEMDDIKRRREEVATRYDARLDYLQAKLKGAQLHEKLLRK